MAEANFPYIADCPDCEGTGTLIAGDPERGSGHWVFMSCHRCNDTGKIIPPEWLGETP